MPLWTLILLIALNWLMYPIVGAISVGEAIARGNRPEDASFSFMPELIVFPPLFLGLAMLIDYFVEPWGRWIVATLCVAMMLWGVVISVRSLAATRRIEEARERSDRPGALSDR